jgi:hypothetical protein
MKIKLTRNTFVEGQSLSVGDEIEVKDTVGRSLILMGKALEVMTAAPVKEKRIIVDANDGVTDEEVSEAARVLREAEHTKATPKSKKKGT